MMQTAASDEPDQTTDRLAGAIAASVEPVFAVVDGGHFEDLPASLRAAGLFARSLFLDHADVEVERAGPWLVPLDSHDGSAGRLLALVCGRPALVAWTTTAGEPALFRHLRTLNMARIPAWAAQGGSRTPPDGEAAHAVAYQSVMFRHWDPRVLGALLPTLDAGQFRRFLGPASGLAFHAENHGGLKRVVADPHWPAAPPGLLTVRSEQVEAMLDRGQDAADRALARYLRQVAPEDTAALSNAALHEKVLAYRVSAARVGLIEEPTVAQWAYLMLSTNDQFERQPRVRAFVMQGPGTPDRNLDALMAGMHRLAEIDERKAC